MKIGYLTNYSHEEPARAKRLGFDCIELQLKSWFGEPLWIDQQQRQQMLDDIKRCHEEFGIVVSAVTMYHPGLNLKGKELHDAFVKAIEVADVSGVKIIAAIAARPDTTKSIADNIPAYREIWGPIAKAAEDRGVRIAFENWHAFGGYPIAGRTMAYSPEAWDLMFDAVPSKALGLEFDPSHLLWQGIDHIAALRKYKDRVYHVHAKDTEIFYERRNSVGVFGTGWWAYRAPGLGEINWAKFMSELYTIGYSGGVCIEHEDARFDWQRKGANMDKFEEGLRIGLRTLRPLVGEK